MPLPDGVEPGRLCAEPPVPLPLRFFLPEGAWPAAEPPAALPPCAEPEPDAPAPDAFVAPP